MDRPDVDAKLRRIALICAGPFLVTTMVFVWLGRLALGIAWVACIGATFTTMYWTMRRTVDQRIASRPADDAGNG